MQTLTISTTLQSAYPVWPYQEIKDDILGKKYQLSLTFIGSDRAKSLNSKYRSRDYIPNVLSFPLDDTVGDIFICPIVATKEAKNFNLTPRGYMAFLFIHGCLHLNGMDHSDTMDKMEQKYLRKYNIS